MWLQLGGEHMGLAQDRKTYAKLPCGQRASSYFSFSLSSLCSNPMEMSLQGKGF